MAATVGLTAFKLLAGVVSGSVGVLSEGIHSFLDLISAAVSFFTVREAVKPADEDHPFGHGKIETISSLFEALLLVAAAVWIVVEGIGHLRNPQPLAHEALAIATILISLVVSYLTYRHNLRAALQTESSALKVNALHFLSDVVASAGVLIGLILLKATGWLWLDPVMAFGVAIYIAGVAVQQVLHALNELSDTQLPAQEVETIRSTFQEFQGRFIEAHDLRTRKSGVTRHVDFHLVVCGFMTVDESHQVCDEMESKINTAFPTASVNIHVEPCPEARENCPARRGEGCPHLCHSRRS